MATEGEFPKVDGDVLYASEVNSLPIYTHVEAGENITADNVVYINQSDGKAYVSDHSTANDLRADGIAIDTATTGNDLAILKSGTAAITCTADSVYYLGSAGAITTDITSVKIGLAIDTDKLFIDIRQDDKAEVGTIKAWHKTFGEADSGTASATTADKLVEAGQNFETTCEIGMIIHNTSDDTFAYITAVDSDTTLSISADIMADTETYVIYKTRKHSAFWVECNGAVLSDAESIYNGETIPDLNADAGSDQRFLRGNTTSGSTGGADSHTHTTSNNETMQAQGGYNITKAQTTSSAGTLPKYMEVVWIIKIK